MMPRTVESIVACHVAATERRNAGKPIWDRRIAIKMVLADYEEYGDDITAEKAVEMANRMGVMLESGVPAAWRQPEHENYNMDFEDLVERFVQADVSDFTPTKDWLETPCDTINRMLEELYDWGDRCRVWLG
jgi:hypothetical protein